MNLTSRDKAFIIEERLLDLPQCPIGTRHYFADGVYAREMSAPAGAVITGKIHKYSQINILSKGHMSVLLDDEVQDIEAPFTISAPAGSKRVFLCHTDCVWTTILGTELQDPDAIEEAFTASSEGEYLAFIEHQKLIGKA